MIDEVLMRHTLSLAKKGLGKTYPNPMVGAIIVKDGEIVGTGYHRAYGLPHAEVEALRIAGQKAFGATLYVNLEPCSHYGKTPPCVDAIIKAGIKEVVIGTVDPNPLVRGNGIKRLKEAGISVKVGILERLCKETNEAFFTYMTKKRPFFTLKLALSLDGKIATKSGDSKWITGDLARRYVHVLRASSQAVIVGINTVIKDDPLLTCRLKRPFKNPKRVILDSSGKIPEDAKVLENPENCIIFTTESGESNLKFARDIGAKVLVCGKAKVNLDLLQKELFKMDMVSVLVEGGAEVAGSFFDRSLIDKVFFFISPKIFGGRKAKPALGGEGVLTVKEAKALKRVKVKRFGCDILISGYINEP